MNELNTSDGTGSQELTSEEAEEAEVERVLAEMVENFDFYKRTEPVEFEAGRTCTFTLDGWYVFRFGDGWICPFAFNEEGKAVYYFAINFPSIRTQFLDTIRAFKAHIDSSETS